MRKRVNTTTKKVAKKAKRVAKKVTRHEVVVRVASQPMIPTSDELAEPIRDGKNLTIPKTWLSEKQITRMVERTPAKYVYQRPAKGGGKWDYVTVGYVQRVLDYCFGFNWDFQIVEHGKEQDHVWVRGKLIVKSPDGTKTITKEQFGRSEVKFQTERQGDKRVRTEKFLDYGNDLKAASSDALKKCASMLGIARDIYSKGDYRQESGNEPRDAQPALPPAPTDQPRVEYECHGAHKGGCGYGGTLTQAEYDYSMRIHQKPLCRKCQSEVGKKLNDK